MNLKAKSSEIYLLREGSKESVADMLTAGAVRDIRGESGGAEFSEDKPRKGVENGAT